MNRTAQRKLPTQSTTGTAITPRTNRGTVRLQLFALEPRNPAGSLLDVLLAGAAATDLPTPTIGSNVSIAMPEFVAHDSSDAVRLDPEPVIAHGSTRTEADATPTSEPFSPFVDFEQTDLIPAWVAMPMADSMTDVSAERPPAGDGSPVVEAPQAGGVVIAPASKLEVTVPSDAANIVLPAVSPGTGTNDGSSGPATPGYNPPGGYNWVDIVQSAKVHDVTFSGADLITIEADPGTDPYPNPPHWLDTNLDGLIDWDAGERQLPVGYPRNTSVTVSAHFVPTVGKMPSVPSDYNLVARAVNLLSATQPYFFNMPWTPVYADPGGLYLPPTVVGNPFPDYVNYGSLKLDWHFSRNGGATWTPAGLTENELYVTLATPSISPVYHTYLYLSIPNSATVPAVDEATVIRQTWYSFGTRHVRTKDARAAVSGIPLTYYKEWDTVNQSAVPLLRDHDGGCGAFSQLFVNSLRAAGAGTTPLFSVEVASKSNESLLINSWNFTDPGTSMHGKYPYQNELADPTKNPNAPAHKSGVGCYTRKNANNEWEYYWGATVEAADKLGVPGQNTENPLGHFGDHTMIRIGTTYYDPSYGIKHNSLKEWEDGSVPGFLTYDLKPNGDWRIIARKNLATEEDIRFRERQLP